MSKQVFKKFKKNNKIYYSEWPTWPFTKLEPHQINYFENKDRIDKFKDLGDPPV